MIKLRKYLLFFGLTNIATVPTLNLVACTNDSLYKEFLKYVDDSKKNKSAFFGLLGTRDDDNCATLMDTIDFFNKNKLKEFNQDNSFFKLNGIEGKIDFHYFIKEASAEKPSDPTKSFWEDKSISWQKLIFNWIWENVKVKRSNSNWKDPIYLNAKQLRMDPLPKEITADKAGNYPFESSTIFFLVVNGELVTAGQNWNWSEKTNNISTKIEDLKDFIKNNIPLKN